MAKKLSVDALSWVKIRQNSRLLTLLFSADPRCFRRWLVKIPEIDRQFGKEQRHQMTSLLTHLARKDVDLARQAVFTLPEQVGQVAVARQKQALAMVRWLVDEHVQMVSLLLQTLPTLMTRHQDDQLAEYLSRCLDVFLESPKRAEAMLMGESLSARRVERSMQEGLRFEEVVKNMTYYARAHCGEHVQVRRTRGGAFTDGNHVYLPDKIELDEELAWLAYTVLTAHNAGYIEFGTMSLDLAEIDGNWRHPREGETELERLFRSFSNSALAEDLFLIFENYRIEAAVRRDYPGVGRRMDLLGQRWRISRRDVATTPLGKCMQSLRERSQQQESTIPLASDQRQIVQKALERLEDLQDSEATVVDSVAALTSVYDHFYGLLTLSKPNSMLRSKPSSGAENTSAQSGYERLPKQQNRGEIKVSEMSPEDRRREDRARRLKEEIERQGSSISMEDARKREGLDFAEVSEFMDRMPGPSGPLREDGKVLVAPKEDHKLLVEDVEILPNAWTYPEWDMDIEDIKPDWTQVREFQIHPSSLEFSDAVLAEYGTEITRTRKIFEALRPEQLQKRRGVEEGSEFDFERLISSRIDLRCGRTPSSRVYVDRNRQHRDTAVAFLLDLSSSTNELANEDGKRILDVEKEALVVISEAVQAIGDRFAIYGFSGYGRDQVAFYIAKDIDEPWSDLVRERIGQMSWKMENRDGAAIRHCTSKMKRWDAKNKVLLLLSDGKPLDCGCPQYCDEYAQQDTRAALRDARKEGIQPFCITVDPYGQEYLAQMYGANRYIVIDRAQTLPSKIAKIYRSLTL